MASAYYILVESTTAGWALHNALKGEGCKVRIAPVPRGLQACCGMSILVNPEDMAPVREALAKPGMPGYERIEELQLDLDPKRDRYC